MSNLQPANIKPGTAALAAEKRKCTKYTDLCKALSLSFCPLSFDACGAPGPLTAAMLAYLFGRASLASDPVQLVSKADRICRFSCGFMLDQAHLLLGFRREVGAHLAS